jgi:hypothetical protein
MKTKNVVLLNTLMVLSVALTLIGCGKRNGGSTTVNVQFANQTANILKSEMNAIGPRGFLPAIELQSNSLLGETPLVYQMKFVAMYLVEAIDENQNNVGDMTRIWTSRKCDADLTLCGIGPAAGQYEVDYFNFAAGTAAVNQALASYERDTQESTLNPGTYNYIRIDFTGATGAQIDTSEPNLMFGSVESHEVRAQVQGLTIALPSPLVLAEGESFTVDLAYDLENRFYESGTANAAPAEVSDASKWTCEGDGVGVPCIVEAEFSPTVTKNQ